MPAEELQFRNPPLPRIALDGRQVENDWNILSLEAELRADAAQIVKLAIMLGGVDPIGAIDAAGAVFKVGSQIAWSAGDAAPLSQGRIASRRLELDQGAPTFHVDARGDAGFPESDGTTLKVTYGISLVSAGLSDPAHTNWIECAGHTKLVPGNRVELANVGDRWNGPHTIVAAHHRLSGDGWTCRVELGERL
ncbi:MAG: hypothetical protein IE933_11620 [Sphingomonadales bacterium]|nr:hypothetical protein [Sphingomonadales bacterium]MBD3774569.1 hypothetical protein [Paracoccaceae bacterium]MBD3814120.1 hypothetical protein [Betaproteobacteria bacterium]